MIKFLKNTGDYFSSNYFDEDFASKVLGKCGYGADEIKEFNKKIPRLKTAIFATSSCLSKVNFEPRIK
jgi:hypothetical protein